MPETINVKGAGGSVFTMALPLHPDIEKRLVRGHLQRVNADGTPWVPGATDEPEGAPPAPPTERPALSAAKADWIGWAVVCGAIPDDAEALTKQDLIDRYGLSAPAEVE